MPTTPQPQPGLEYTVIQDGNIWVPDPIKPEPPPPPGSLAPYTWASVIFKNAEPIELNGFKIKAKYRTVTFIPGNPGLPGDLGDRYEYEYPDWKLVEQKLKLSNRPEGSVFTTNTGNELFTAEPGKYGEKHGEAVAGITDGTEYGYPGVFNKTKTAYIERLEPYDSTPVYDKVVPSQPYDEDKGIYPIDTLTQYHPDTRDSVWIEYELSTKFEYQNKTYNEKVGIRQLVYQKINNWGGVVQQIVERAYFTHGRIPLKP